MRFSKIEQYQKELAGMLKRYKTFEEALQKMPIDAKERAIEITDKLLDEYKKLEPYFQFSEELIAWMQTTSKT